MNSPWSKENELTTTQNPWKKYFFQYSSYSLLPLYILWPKPQRVLSFYLGANFSQWKKYNINEQQEHAVKIFQN